METSYRNLTCADARPEHVGRSRHRRLGEPPPRPGPAHLPRPARPLRDHPGRRRCDRGAGGPCHRIRRSAASSSSGSRGTIARRLRGHREPEASRPATSSCARPTSRSCRTARTPPFVINEPDAEIDEAAAPEVPLPGPAPRAAASSASWPVAGSSRPSATSTTRPASSRSRRRCSSSPRQRARATSSSPRDSSRAASTRCPRARSSSSSCSWSAASTATSRSRAACATRTCAATGSPSSPSSTSR